MQISVNQVKWTNFGFIFGNGVIYLCVIYHVAAIFVGEKSGFTFRHLHIMCFIGIPLGLFHVKSQSNLGIQFFLYFQIGIVRPNARWISKWVG